ncbi:hypothetical protein PspLS_11924 [Pyricularia sp. CBS 133598]|nr:hypothetical protein PspLS_11924 [Pyricularia sp. CBS 133598]
MWKCHLKYGNTVRYAPNGLLFNSATGMRDIYSFGSSSSFIKGVGYEPMIHRAPNTLTISGGREHARRRRILAQGVSERTLRSYEHRIMSHILTLVKVVSDNANKSVEDQKGRRWGPSVNMSDLCSYLSFDIMADVIFDAQYNLLEEPRFRYIVDAIEKSNTRMAGLVQAPYFARLKVDKYFFRTAIFARNRFLKFLGRMLSIRLERLSQGEDCKSGDNENGDLFSNLAAATDPETGSKFTADELAAESATLVFAGTDTSSISLAAVLFYLAHNPACYERAAAEVRAALGKGQPASGGAALTSCVYLRACIEEAMRMSPPVGGALWREVATEGGATVAGEFLPRGTAVGVPLYSVQHSEAYYEDPFTYKPERWLVEGGNDASSVEKARSVFAPFSIGQRSCLGKALAMHELMLTTATLLSMGDFKLPDGEEAKVGCGKAGATLGRHRQGEFQLKDYITGQKEGPILQFSFFD